MALTIVICKIYYKERNLLISDYFESIQTHYVVQYITATLVQSQIVFHSANNVSPL